VFAATADLAAGLGSETDSAGQSGSADADRSDKMKLLYFALIVSLAAVIWVSVVAFGAIPSGCY
jgi:hypothetical protein